MLLEVVFPLTVGRKAFLPDIPGGLATEVNLEMYSFFASQCALGGTDSRSVYIPDESDLEYVVEKVNEDLAVANHKVMDVTLNDTTAAAADSSSKSTSVNITPQQ